MAKQELISWIGYWDRGSDGPRIDRVRSFDDLVNCRRFNRCMNGGVMWNVTDAQMWDAVQAYHAA